VHRPIPLRFGFDFLIVTQADAFNPDFNCAFDPGFSVIGLEQQTVRGETTEFDPLVYFGSAQAMFFLLFTAQGGAISILEDRRQGVLQRMIVSPTPRMVILLGKLFGTFISALVQLVILFVAFTVVGSLIGGGLTFIWGTNWLLIAVVVIGASLSVSGLGTLLASLAKTPEQANIFGTTINIAMGAVGGAFFAANQIPALQPVQWFSLVYWGQDAFTTLSTGGTDIWLNVVVMLVQGAVMFLIGLWIFGRRLDV
jgi:ABC-2 type transport system permease protein